MNSVPIDLAGKFYAREPPDTQRLTKGFTVRFARQIYNPEQLNLSVTVPTRQQQAASGTHQRRIRRLRFVMLGARDANWSCLRHLSR
jgi:hypothetical protein